MTIIVVGVVLLLVGVATLFLDRLGIGRLPGDIHIASSRGTFSFPIVTCLLISVVLTVVLNIVLRLMSK